MSTTGVRFCLAVPKSLKHPKYSDNTYQVRVAHRLAECLKTSIMENRLMSTFVPTDRQINIECDDQPVFTSCCTIDETPTDLNNCGHSTHFVLIYIPKLWLKQCASLLRPDLSIDKQELNNCVQKLTDGQTAWLAELAIRSLVLSKAHIKSLVCDLGLSLNLIDNIDEYILSNRPALFILEYLGLISNLTRSHDKMERRSIWTDHFSTLNVFPNSEKLRQYLGDSIGFYFVWMKSYCVYLTCPLIAGLFCQVFNLLNGQHFEDKQVSLGIHLVYTIFMILWAVICTKLWQREYISCVDRWSGNALIELAANDLAWLFNFIDQRPTFHGTWRQSRVTGLMELHYPAAKRRLRYVASGFITLACLLWAIFVNIALLNMEGFIVAEKSPWFHIGFVSQFAEPDAIFDPNANGILSYIPGVLHSLMVFVMNQIIFRAIAEHLTEWENHCTNKDYERALIIKRFLFELVDAYGGLIYLGFILADRLALRSLLLTMFATDSIRRLTLECIIPYIIYRFRAWKEKQSIGLIKRNHNSEKPMYQIRVERELCADIYESFDDYLEMVLQHGYLVLFAYASPLFITILAILCTFLEIHFDVFKLFWVTQCPKSNLLLREQSIWLLLLGIQAWLSVLTNAGLLISEIHRLEILTDVTASTIFLIFEHCLIFIALCIHFLISDTPVTVRDARLARDFARARLLSPKKDN
ncbi:hypothetical protein MS3_00005164 [Schistosoma haematobium]|uniref:Anoctamin n=1 Tax=Schistosoma haematobium TaxID=6185 RepID=A0A094ZVR9_SCHHA|nr:hypothetical protein MS3_00005164 [Schistosoma haematobium]KAH9587422.1 hypothetical protein MS3_00005164 [Schistosoma haematobium]CAH8546336.1 unnamed protein product [Schistosoma haematobium]CAH8550279.1 unnamed protein product [Schistosoma haematobium]